jgi:hypothetical protein
MALPSAILLLFTHDLIDLHTLLVLIIISLFVGGVLEIISVKQGRKDKFFIWEYNSKTTLNKKIFGVAVEDMILFLVLTPIFAVSAWEALKKAMSAYQYPMIVTLVVGLSAVLATYYILYKLTKPK